MTPLTSTKTHTAMPWSVLPGSGGLHFRCNGKADPSVPASCRNGALLATLNATGKAANYTRVADAPIPD